jgi:glycosyltransferase involved in cell wall biosynthesis
MSDGRRPRVAYWNNIPAPYMVERFNAVADHGMLDFEAWFSRRTEPGRSWTVDESTWRFHYRYLAGRDGRGKRAFPGPLLRGKRPDVLVSLYAEPVFVAGWLLARVRGTRQLFWCEVTFASWVRRRRWRRWLRRAMFRTATGVVSAGEDGVGFALAAGARRGRTPILPHAVDVEFYRQASAALRASRAEIRQELRLCGVTFLYVGRLWRGKGIDVLLRAFGEVQRGAPRPVSLLVAGDGPDEAWMRGEVESRGLENVVFAGFQQRDELVRCYVAADVFVFPTLGDPYGMVVDEALACGLPVISTNAAGELSRRVRDGVNGYVVGPGDHAALSDAMRRLADDATVRETLAARAGDGLMTPSEWAVRLEGVVREALAWK